MRARSTGSMNPKRPGSREQRENNLGSREQKILGIILKNLT